MFAIKAYVLAICFAVIIANPIDSSVEEMRSLCANDDTLACINYKFMSFLNTVFKKDSFKLSDNIEVVRNEYRANEVNNARGEDSFEDSVKEYIASHDVTVKLPFSGSSVTVGARNVDSGELDFKLKFSEAEEGRGKLKKIMVPIMAFIFFKAFTLIPLALGVFGIGTMHALQFSLFNFILAVVMTVFQFSKKIHNDNAHPHIAHGPWEAYKQRSFVDNVAQPEVADDVQKMVYNAYN